MPIVDSLERKYGWLAIPGIVRVLAGFQLLTFFLFMMNRDMFELLALDPGQVMKGEVWRLLSFVFLPPTMRPILLLFALFFMVFMGEMLERMWGSFRLTLYLAFGVLCLVLASFFVYYVVGDLGRLDPEGKRLGNEFYSFLYRTKSTGFIWVTTILWAVAVLQPGLIINIMGILPVKLYWLALFDAGLVLIDFVMLSGVDLRLGLALLFVISNFLIVFGPAGIRMARQRSEVAARRRKFEMAKIPVNESLHRCATCDRTEHDDPDLEFRVAADGEEYCREHLPPKD